MKMKILLLFLLILTSFDTLHLEEIPDCWCIPELNKVYETEGLPDLQWAIDSCDIGFGRDCNVVTRSLLNVSNSDELSERLFCKEGFLVVIDTIIITRNSSTQTSFTWKEIGDNFTELKKQFRVLEEKYGSYHIRTESQWEEDIRLNRQGFSLSFENFINLFEVIDFLATINDSLSMNKILYSSYSWINELVNVAKPLAERIIYIYPNPATDYIEINLDNVETDLQPVSEEIEIFDVLGDHPSLTIPTSEEGTVRLDISNLQPGIYFIRVGNEFLKFVKN